MIEDRLVEYGVFGLWTASLLIQNFKINSDMKKTISNNTVALIKLSTMLKNKK